MTVLSRTAPPTTRPTTTTAAPAATPPSLAPSPLRAALRLSADPSRWRPFVDFDPDRRYYRRLLADEHHEAWLRRRRRLSLDEEVAPAVPIPLGEEPRPRRRIARRVMS